MHSRRLRVAYQGEPGAFSEAAARRLAGAAARLLPCRDFARLFAVLGAGADAIVAPVENSIAGPVAAVAALRARWPDRLLGECTLPIALHLIVRPGVRFASIRSVASHPVALAQCRGLFAQHPNLRAVVADDTAGSVRAMMRGADPARAALASAAAAARYGAVVRRRHVEDDRSNHTRFLLLGPA